MRKRNSIKLIFIVFFSIGMSNGQIQSQANTQGYDAAIAFTLGAGEYYNPVALRGIVDVRSNYNISIHTTEAWDEKDMNHSLLGWAGDPKFDMIISVGDRTQPGVFQAATTYPQAQFILIDGEVNLPNVASVGFKLYEASFLAGAMAALTTTKDQLGFIGGMESDLVNRFGSAFEQGARWVNPDIIVVWEYYPPTEEPSNSNNDIEGTKVLTATMIATGIDIIHVATGVPRAMSIGALQAAEEATLNGSKTYIIPDWHFHSWPSPYNVLTTLVKNMTLAVETHLGKFMDGTRTIGHSEWGLKEGGVGITEILRTQEEANAECGEMTRLEFVNSLTDFIINGSVVIKEDIVPKTNWNKIVHNCTGTFFPENTSTTSSSESSSEASSTLSTTSTTPTSSSSQSSDAAIPGLGYRLAVFSLIISVVPIHRLRRKN